jgi:hypothetical protein
VVTVTQRDARVLEFVGAQYAVRADLLGVVLARLAPDPRPGAVDSRRVRGWLERMERATYVRRVRLVGRTYAVATQAGLGLCDLPGHPWREVEWKLGHLHAVAAVRLALAEAHPGARWRSDRELRSEVALAREAAGGSLRQRIADGALVLGDGRTVGVEVELSRKRPGDYGPIVREVDASFSEVWWFARPGDVAWLERALDAAGASGHRVAQLPAGAVS